MRPGRPSRSVGGRPRWQGECVPASEAKRPWLHLGLGLPLGPEEAALPPSLGSLGSPPILCRLSIHSSFSSLSTGCTRWDGWDGLDQLPPESCPVMRPCPHEGALHLPVHSFRGSPPTRDAQIRTQVRLQKDGSFWKLPETAGAQEVLQPWRIWLTVSFRADSTRTIFLDPMVSLCPQGLAAGSLSHCGLCIAGSPSPPSLTRDWMHFTCSS